MPPTVCRTNKNQHVQHHLLVALKKKKTTKQSISPLKRSEFRIKQNQSTFDILFSTIDRAELQLDGRLLFSYSKKGKKLVGSIRARVERAGQQGVRVWRYSKRKRNTTAENAARKIPHGVLRRRGRTLPASSQRSLPATPHFLIFNRPLRFRAKASWYSFFIRARRELVPLFEWRLSFATAEKS